MDAPADGAFELSSMVTVTDAHGTVILRDEAGNTSL